MKIISYFTDDWLYPEFADSLVEDCERLDLDYYIKGIDSFGDYRLNCGYKPSFILECLQKFEEPVLWVKIMPLII